MSGPVFRSVAMAILVAALGWSALRESPDVALAQGGGATQTIFHPSNRGSQTDRPASGRVAAAWPARCVEI